MALKVPGNITTSRGKNTYSDLHKDVVNNLLSLDIDLFLEKKIEKESRYILGI